ncbi:MAG: adenylate/guanylate cyclase domain-containing protein [Fibrobacteres bacterium]|nr:adenylate/guanylate cyclase domain-containing protein [Fibrobacterota bacterium]
MKKHLKKAGIAIAGALLVSLFLKVFMDNILRDFWVSLENKTYDLRYQLKYDSKQQVAVGDAVMTEKLIEDVAIVNIDERSMLADKMGVYYKWPRSYHGQLIEYLKSGNGAVTTFDIHFNDADYGKKETDRIYGVFETQQSKAGIQQNELERLKGIIAEGVNYDRDFVEATKRAGNVIHAMILNDTLNYANRSDYEARTTEEHRNSCNPTSAARLTDTVTSVIRNYKVLDGAFPELATAAARIGLVNVDADFDGVHRKIPLLNKFRGYVYPTISLQTILFLMGKSIADVEINPGKELNLGKPFVIRKDAEGKLETSYPGVTGAMVKALINSKKRIDKGTMKGDVSVSEKIVVFKDAQGVLQAEIMAGTLSFSSLRDVNGLTETDFKAIPLNEPTPVSEATGIIRTAEEEFTIVELQNGERTIEFIPLATMVALAQIDGKSAMLLKPEEKSVVQNNLTVELKDSVLSTEYIFLRGKVLDELLALDAAALENLPAGGKLEFGEPVRIPVDENYRMRINYLGRKQVTFRTISYYDVWYKRTPSDLFSGKIFLIGSDAPSMFDIVASPVDEDYPGVEIHATVMADIIQGNFMKDPEVWKTFLILLILVALAALISQFVKPFIALPLIIIAGLAYFLYAFGEFEKGINLEVIRPIIGLFGAFIFTLIYKYITEEKDKKFLKATFQSYLSPELIDQMYENRQFPELGGEEAVCTAYFTDIQGFSTFSEKLGSAKRIVELLNEYLSGMTDILMANGGTLDKYIGDAIVAIYGAPMPLPDHAEKAVRTAIGMQLKLEEMRAKWKSEGDKWPEIVHNMRMRIGINSGTIVTGNMGSQKRMNYTMMGDPVNLAARLESASKQYGIFTMISDATMALVEGKFDNRELDKIIVMGKTEPVTVYEILAERGKATPLEREIIDRYHEGLAMYKKQEWDKAIAIFYENAKVEKKWRPDQKTNPSLMYIDRCEGFKLNPPGADWDGVFKMKSK